LRFERHTLEVICRAHYDYCIPNMKNTVELFGALMNDALWWSGTAIRATFTYVFLYRLKVKQGVDVQLLCLYFLLRGRGFIKCM
jgi:hypothetical protein